jgi:hypothetical protein
VYNFFYFMQEIWEKKEGRRRCGGAPPTTSMFVLRQENKYNLTAHLKQVEKNTHHLG